MGRFIHASVWAVLVFILTILTTTEKAHAEISVKRGCLPVKLNVKALARPTEIVVTWVRFTPRRDCTTAGARYDVVIKWQPKNEEERLAIRSVKEKHFDVTGLKPTTPVTITAYLNYTDAEGEEHTGPQSIIKVSTSVDGPSAPRNLKQETLSRTEATFVWEDPEVPGGPLDGFVYQVCEAKDCNSETICKEVPLETPERHKLTIRRMAPNRYYRVKVAAYNILQLSREKIYGDYSSACFKAEPPTTIHPRDLRAECKANPNSLTLTWKPPHGKGADSYVVEVTGNTEHAQKIEKDIGIKDICKGEECTYSVDGLKGGLTYEVILVAKEKDIGDDSAFTECTVPESAPPPPTQDIKLVYDRQEWWWVTPKETQQAFQFPSDLFSDINGHVEPVTVLIAQDSNIDDCEKPVAWEEANAREPVPCYILSEPFADGGTCRHEDAVQICILGTDENCKRKPSCNGPLREGVKYGLKLRGSTRAGQTESKPVFFTAGSPPKSTTTGSGGRTVESLALIGGILVLTVFMIRP
ncbi:receptor-type tyrosine-protein phosphatase delta-like [Ornithodoros turicata]|uniref:receptor-type tyrosine-protein phosphatase delta-like n=1 Tax=Ornithodoros turicata TaxID=34597 RepID=UPI00313900F4